MLNFDLYFIKVILNSIMDSNHFSKILLQTIPQSQMASLLNVQIADEGLQKNGLISIYKFAQIIRKEKYMILPKLESKEPKLGNYIRLVRQDTYYSIMISFRFHRLQIFIIYQRFYRNSREIAIRKTKTNGKEISTDCKNK